MMTKIRKTMSGYLRIAIALCLCIFFSCALVACNTIQPPEKESAKQEKTLVLPQYSTTLYVGETYTLTPKIVDETGEEKPLNNATYTVELAHVVACENGKLTALAEGNTSVYIEADGLQTSFFVAVKDELREGEAGITFMEENLYVGLPVQAHLWIKQGDEVFYVSTATWSVEDESLLTVSENGRVTPLQTAQNAVVIAECSVNGVSYTANASVQIKEFPLSYTTSVYECTVATSKTYSGAPNTKYQSATFQVQGKNLLTGESRQLGAEEFEIQDNAALTTQIAADGTVTVSAAKNVNAQEKLTIKVGDKDLAIKINVAIAIASVADMDALTVASYNNQSDLAHTYVLVNDIDYQGEVIYPIAAWKHSNRILGIQWKYALDYVDGKYVCLPRADVGKADKCLTDEEFIALSRANGINPNVKGFGGTFDGNGYAIKNAKLMYAPFIVSETNVYSAEMGVFGLLSGGTVKNVCWELSPQDPEEFAQKTGQTLDRAYIGGAIVDAPMQKKANTDAYTVWTCSLIARGISSTVENVLFKFSCNDDVIGLYSATGMSALVGWDSTMRVSNNVVFVENDVDGIYYAVAEVCDTLQASNNLSLGARRGFSKNYSATSCGENGNWWTESTDWSDLLSEQQGADASYPISLTDVISSFDKTVWDFTTVSSEGFPTLLNGCSVR